MYYKATVMVAEMWLR